VSSKPQLRGVVAALFGSLCAAAFLIPWKIAALQGEPKLAVLVLLSTAALLNTLAVCFERVPTADAERRWGPTLGLAAALAVLTLLGNLASAQSVERISGALLSVLQRSEVLLVAVLGRVVLGERVRPSFWVGVAVAGTGLWVLQRDQAAVGLQAIDSLGVRYGVASALCFGGMIVLTRRYVRRVRLLVLNSARLWLSVLLWFLLERRLPEPALLTPALVGPAALAAFFGPFLSRLSALYSARYVAANVTAFSSLATPVLTLVLAFLILGNLPQQRELVGGGLMLAGLTIPLAAALRRTGAPW